MTSEIPLALRWEHEETGDGPYGYLKPHELCFKVLDGEPGCTHLKGCIWHPAPYHDGLEWDLLIPPPGLDVYDGRFGFRSVEQMDDWFPARIQAIMRARGFVQRTYYAKKVLYGGHQLLFWPAGKPIRTVR